jgi:hypothetical protein
VVVPAAVIRSNTHRSPAMTTSPQSSHDTQIS